MKLTGALASRVGIGAVILYLAAHGLTGRQGLLSYVALQSETRALQRESRALSAEIATREAQIARLRVVTLDLDYVEERARRDLRYVAADEVVIFTVENATQP